MSDKPFRVVDFMIQNQERIFMSCEILACCYNGEYLGEQFVPSVGFEANC